MQARTGHNAGCFFRSDTNLEDLPGFNGAGLNATIGNVSMDREKVDHAIREVWASAFQEKSITWRATAVGGALVPVAYPSVVVMPTVRAKTSGVLISKGGSDWKPGRGQLSANYGIGSVVEADRPVEEFTFETGEPVRFSMSVSTEKPSVSSNGGLASDKIRSPKFVLSLKQASELAEFGNLVERTFGQLPYGWDLDRLEFREASLCG